MSGETENYSLSTQQQLDMELPLLLLKARLNLILY